MRRVFLGGVLVLLAASGCAGERGIIAVRPPARAPEGLAARIAAEGDRPNGQVDHFAVLVGANTELRHRGNLSLAYQVLVEQGYRRDHVWILDSDGASDLFPVTDVTSRATVVHLFDHLKKIVEPHDTLLVYVTGHGRRVSAELDARGVRTNLGVSTLLLDGKDELAEWELQQLFDGLAPEAGVVFFDQCYGGAFAAIAKSCRWVFITTAADDATSYGVSFPRAFWGSFRARGDRGALGIRDAYELARANDRGTRLGFNRPALTEGCVRAAGLTLLGERRPEPIVLSAGASKP